MEEPGFWDDPERSTKLMKEAKNLKDTVEGFQKRQFRSWRTSMRRSGFLLRWDMRKMTRM